MKRIIGILFLILVMSLLVSCGLFLPKDDYGETPGGSSSKPEGPFESNIAIFNALFDETSHVSIKLDISDSELKKIQEDYEKYSSMGSKSPIYRMADMVITITTANGTGQSWSIPQVGVRMKGNTSRTSFYSDEDGMYNLIHFKVSFGETFDDEEYYGSDALVWSDPDARKERKDRTFATLEKIDLRWNRNDDPTYIRENYAYDLYREFGVLAPHTTLTSLDIADDHAGVWVLYEPVDKLFLEKNLPKEARGGDLYKLGWTYEGATFTSFSSVGVEDEDNCKFYVYDLKTNKKTSTHESLKILLYSLQSASLSKEEFASLVDIDNFMYYLAVSYMVGNPDDLRNNYNNTYIYFRADTGKMMVIPYDSDRGLGVNTWNPYGHGMTVDDPFATENVCGQQKNPLFLKSICEGGMFIEEYIEALKKVDASEMLTNAYFAERFDIASDLYSKETKTSKNYHNAKDCRFSFDLEKTALPEDSANMSFADYMYYKRATLYSAIGNQGNTDSYVPDNGGGSTGNSPDDGHGEIREPIANCAPYIRADFTSWEVDEEYKLTDNGDGTFSITISKTHGVKLKIYDNNNKKWYGTEVVDNDCTVWYATDNHTNVYLDSGSYTVTFDANTVTIYLEKH